MDAKEITLAADLIQAMTRAAANYMAYVALKTKAASEGRVISETELDDLRAQTNASRDALINTPRP
jgi:hypothetical protein